MERAHVVRQIGELLSSHSALRDAWPLCSGPLASLVGGRSAEIVAADASVTAIEPQGTTYTVTVPLRFDRELLGAIRVYGAGPIDDVGLALLEGCAFTIATRVYFERFTQSSERLAELARVDPLTGIANRRRFDELFDAACRHAQLTGTSLSLAVLDIDYFKAFNDTYGHQAGDACLRLIAAALQTCARRPDDLVARYGGEEFVLLLPGASLDAAIGACESVCEAVANLAITHAGTSLGRVSISAGAAMLARDAECDAFFREADEALYRAKLGGRNRVAAAGYVSSSAAAERVTADGGSNVPEPPNRIIGRSRELHELAARISQHRLLTITGIGGCGKTRMAIEAGTRALGHFEDGVWFVDLSAIADESLLAPTISSLFNRTRDGSAQELLAAVGRKHSLLVLDNCEQLLQPIARLAAEILEYCPRAHLLATSREPLGIANEAIFALQPLNVPQAGIELDVAETLTYDAVGLFVERLRESNHDFALDATSAALAAAICRRLDGIPLALELAAPRAALVGLERLEADLERRPTMHSVIAWSCGLLSEQEARVFRRLAIFSGGFRPDAAVEVCWDSEITSAEVSAALERLARKSLLAVDWSQERARIRMLETIREYAHDQLTRRGEFAELRRRHAQWALAFARQHDMHTYRAAGRSWIGLMTQEIDNFRAAVAWALFQGADLALGCKLVAALLGFMHEVAPAEGTRWARRAREALRTQPDAASEAEICYKLAGMREAPAAELRDAAERAVELYRALGDRVGLTRSLRALAQIIGWYFRAEREHADALACEAIEMARTLDDATELVIALRTRGLTIDISDFPAKRAVLEEALALAREHRMERIIGGTLTWISEMEFSAGERQRAYEYGREALQIAESTGSGELYATAVLNFALYAAAVGELENARDAALRGLRVARSTWQESAMTYAIQALAIVASARGDHERAARLIGFCDARDGVLHPPRQADQSEDLTHRALIARLEAELGAARLRVLLDEGGAFSEEAAIREATMSPVEPVSG